MAGHIFELDKKLRGAREECREADDSNERLRVLLQNPPFFAAHEEELSALESEIAELECTLHTRLSGEIAKLEAHVSDLESCLHMEEHAAWVSATRDAELYIDRSETAEDMIVNLLNALVSLVGDKRAEGQASVHAARNFIKSCHDADHWRARPSNKTQVGKFLNQRRAIRNLIAIIQRLDQSIVLGQHLTAEEWGSINEACTLTTVKPRRDLLTI